MSTSYFGRLEPDGRRLGADFELIANWSRNFALRAPVHSYHLSQLSSDDQAALFSGGARQFRLRQGPNDTVKLETVEDGVSAETADEPGTIKLDADVVAMMRTSNYARSEARNYELLCEIEDAQDQSQAVSALKLSDALLRGFDGPTSEKLAEKAAHDVLFAAGQKVVARWRAERIERFTTPNDETPVATTPKEARITIGDIQFNNAPMSRSTATTLSGSPSAPLDCPFSDSEDNQPTPRPQHYGIKCPSPHNAIPDYGSETTMGSVDSGSPTYSTDELVSSPEFESVDSFIHDADGGAGLPSFGLNQELGLRGGDAMAETPTPSARFFSLDHRTSGGHLGAGLGQALFSLPPANAMFAVKTAAGAATEASTSTFLDPVRTAAPSAMDGTKSAAQSVGYMFDPFSWQNRALDVSVPVFTPSSKSPKYPLAKEQPWTGFTCYDVLYKPRNDQLIPKYWTTKLGKERYIRHKIRDLKAEDARLQSDRVLGAVARDPIHIFVDLSNITIGFYNSMKEQRGIPEKKRVVAPAFSFKNFDTILTRDRNVAKRIVAGSLSNTHVKKWPGYMLQARELDYEMNILQRVLKPASPSRKRKSKNGARDVDSPASGPDTSGDDAFLQQMKHGEQGVDELLHLKILQSAMDTPHPATMVLATGDAASAEYSDGFKKNIERVLAHGWHIELYGWRRNISSAWREPEFAERWQHQFKIVELDEFCEELFDMTIESLEQ